MSKPDVVRLSWDLFVVRFLDEDIGRWSVPKGPQNMDDVKALPPSLSHNAVAYVEIRSKTEGGVSLYCFRCRRADDCVHAGEVLPWLPQSK